MKSKVFAIGLVLAAAVVAVGQTRTFTFEKSGKTVEGEVIDVNWSMGTASLKLADGQTYSLKISYLVKDDQSYLGSVASRTESEKAKVNAFIGKCEGGRRTISGKVLQKIPPNGLLVFSGYDTWKEVGVTKHYPDQGIPGVNGAWNIRSVAPIVFEGDKPGAACLGVVLLLDYPQYEQVVDEDRINDVTAYPAGEYSYTTANQSSKVVRMFSTSLDKAAKSRAAQKEEAERLAAERRKTDQGDRGEVGVSGDGGQGLIAGTILQKLPDGLLVESGAEPIAVNRSSFESRSFYHGWTITEQPGPPEIKKQPVPDNLVRGLIMLVGFRDYSEVVDGDIIRVSAHPVGVYSYTTAGNATKTVKKFSAGY
jgi:hypothetical protein